LTKNLFAMIALGAGMAGIAMAQGAPPSAAAPAAAPATMAGPPTKVGVIQIQAALAATKEGQKAAADLEVKLGPRKKELDGKQAEIKDLQEKLQRGGNTLSDSAKEDLTRNIDAKTKGTRQISSCHRKLAALPCIGQR